jgi:hypothetical protein
MSRDNDESLERPSPRDDGDSSEPPMPRRSKLKRATTPELERIEKGPPPNLTNYHDRQQSKHDFSSVSDLADDLLGDNLETLGLIETVSDDEQKQQKVKQQNRRGSEMDVHKYMASREMTPNQERMNAVTIVPGAFYCFLCLISGTWLDQALEDETREEMMTGSSDMLFDESGCISSSWLPHLHALPPLPVVAGALGIILHAPFSFIYHWSYAHRLPPGLARTTHWSRRMDQVMIHVCSASIAYATSGRWDFFAVNALYNMDCIYRQLKSRVRPRRNQIRILISVIAYTIPILRRGDMHLFSELWVLFVISFSLFGLYPIGGWSHSAFHLVMAFVPPLLMNAAIELPASQGQLKLAAQCAVIAKQSLVSS